MFPCRPSGVVGLVVTVLLVAGRDPSWLVFYGARGRASSPALGGPLFLDCSRVIRGLCPGLCSAELHRLFCKTYGLDSPPRLSRTSRVSPVYSLGFRLPSPEAVPLWSPFCDSSRLFTRQGREVCAHGSMVQSVRCGFRARRVRGLTCHTTPMSPFLLGSSPWGS